MRKLAVLLLLGLVARAAAQPADDPDPWDPSGSGSGSGSAKPTDPLPPQDPPPPTTPPAGSGSGSGSGSATGSGSGSAGSGSGSGKPTIIQIPTDANAPEVSAAASPTEVRLGAKFTLFVTATYGAGVVVNLREPLELGSGFEVTRKLSEDRPADDGRTTREWQIEVIAWELGELSLPPIAVTYTAFGKADQTYTNRVKLRIVGVLGDVVDDPKALRGNADPRDLMSRDWFWLYVTIGAVVGLAILVGLVLWLRGRRRRGMLVGTGFVAARGRKLDTPSERALAKLLAIDGSGVLDRDDDRKQGYAEMVDVIREYLGTRYRVATYDLTSYELLRQLADVAPDGERDMIEHWLEQCDIVKYGGFQASSLDAHRTLEDARTLVVSTTQPDPVKEAAPPPPAPEPPPEPASSQEAA